MPPPKLKLHKSSGKVKDLKLLKAPEQNTSQVIENNIELELCWCVQKLELSLSSGKLSEKQALDTEKTLRILKGANQPVIKKRQVMRNTFGDYRAQMAEEEKQLSLVAKKIKFTTPKEQKNDKNASKSYFVKKSALQHSGTDFKFNFNVDENQKCSESDTNSEDKSETTKESPEHPDGPDCHDSQSKSKFIPSDNSFRFNFQVE
uniref:Uncharacterized protein n=1 Tax=Lutzomyia longipalpis TaxID=7200 RepID=A0A7G3AKF3_LUTLO